MSIKRQRTSNNRLRKTQCIVSFPMAEKGGYGAWSVRLWSRVGADTEERMSPSCLQRLAQKESRRQHLLNLGAQD